MSIDQRLRTASREIHDTVMGRQGAPLARVARRRSRAISATAITAVCAVTVGIAAWTLDKSPTPAVDAAVSTPPPTSAQVTITTTAQAATTQAPTTAPPDAATVTTTSDDGLSQLELVPEEWQEELAAGGTVLLAEDGVVMVAPDLPDDVEGIAPPVAHVEYMVAGVDLGLSAETSGLPAVWANFVLTADSERVRVFGVAPLGAESVEFRWAGDQQIFIDQVYQRPDVERSVFLGSVDLTVLTENPPAPMQFVVTESDGTVNEYPEFMVQSRSAASDYDGSFTDLFAVIQPLVAGESKTTELDVIACQAPEGVTAPPNRSGTPDDLGTFATSQEALEALVRNNDEDPMLPTSGYLEIPQAGDSIVYAVAFDGGDGFVTIVWVAPTDGGWRVDHWEASGC